MPTRTLILLSCSHHKRSGGERFKDTARSFASSKDLPIQRKSLLDKRKKVFNLLHGENGRLYNEDQRGGYRDEGDANQALLPGPDFGGVVSDELVYLPAYERYKGRFFAAMRRKSPDFWNELSEHPVEILFVSGLYGLLFWDEQIQDYDCHLNDQIVGHKSTVGELWKLSLTDTLCDFIKAARANGQPFNNVFDLLSEETYQNMFDWGRICSNAGVKVYHRVFRRLAGTDALPYIAQILKTDLPRFYDDSKLFKREEWQTCSINHGSTEKFTFEYPIGCAWAWREDALTPIFRDYPELRKFPEHILDQLSLAEHSWHQAQKHEKFDFGTIVVSYAKSLEAWAQFKLPSWHWETKTVKDAIKESMSPSIVAAVDELWQLRNRGAHKCAHPELEITKDDVEKARSLILDTLSGRSKKGVPHSSQPYRDE